MKQMNMSRRSAQSLWMVTGLLVVIGIVIVVRRVLIIGSVLSGGGRGPDFDSDFRVPPALTLLHILPGLLFVILGPLQFIKRIRYRYRTFHRYSGWVFIIAAYLIGLSSFIMPFVSMPIGGINEAAASVFFSLYFLFAVTNALRYILACQTALHREWMLRTFAIGLAIATVRPIMALAFILKGLTPRQFLGTAFWIGFTLHIIAAEAWIRYTRSHQKQKPVL